MLTSLRRIRGRPPRPILPTRRLLLSTHVIHQRVDFLSSVIDSIAGWIDNLALPPDTEGRHNRGRARWGAGTDEVARELWILGARSSGGSRGFAGAGCAGVTCGRGAPALGD